MACGGLEGLADSIVSGARPDDAARLTQAAKARALQQDRKYVVPADIAQVVPDVLRSRVILSGDAEARGVAVDEVLRAILDRVEVP